MKLDMPYLIVGIICLIIGIVLCILNQKISAGSIASFILAIIVIIKGLGLR